MVTVFISILNQMELHLVQNREENCHHDHIPFNMKRNGNIVFSVKHRVLTLQCDDEWVTKQRCSVTAQLAVTSTFYAQCITTLMMRLPDSCFCFKTFETFIIILKMQKSHFLINGNIFIRKWAQIS